MTTVEEQLIIYVTYWNRLADYRYVTPVIDGKEKITEADINIIRDRIFAMGVDVCKCCRDAYCYKSPICSTCKKYDPIKCDSCGSIARIGDIDFRGRNAFCPQCVAPYIKRVAISPSLEQLVRLLAEITGYQIKKCDCDKFFAWRDPWILENKGSESRYIRSDLVRRPDRSGIYNSKILQHYPLTKYELESGCQMKNIADIRASKGPNKLCWNCQKSALEKVIKKTFQCSTCREMFVEEDVVRCDGDCCWQCPSCRVQCDICPAPQCHLTKKCVQPSGGKKYRANGRTCSKCDVVKSVCYNSYSQNVHTDQCPHPWCLACEKHPEDKKHSWEHHGTDNRLCGCYEF